MTLVEESNQKRKVLLTPQLELSPPGRRNYWEYNQFHLWWGNGPPTSLPHWGGDTEEVGANQELIFFMQMSANNHSGGWLGFIASSPESFCRKGEHSATNPLLNLLLFFYCVGFCSESPLWSPTKKKKKGARSLLSEFKKRKSLWFFFYVVGRRLKKKCLFKSSWRRNRVTGLVCPIFQALLHRDRAVKTSLKLTEANACSSSHLTCILPIPLNFTIPPFLPSKKRFTFMSSQISDLRSATFQSWIA